MKIKIKPITEIKIRPEYVTSKKDYEALNNKEEHYRKVFVKIIKDNTDEFTFLRLTDIKKLYTDKLCKDLKDDAKLVQILKNVIGSNKDNSTHLLRDANILWFYCEPTKGSNLEVNDKERRPFPLPKKLERSRSKKYYVKYLSEISDSIVDSIVMNEEKAIVESDEYNDINFSEIKESKSDYIEKQKICQELGEAGEKYVFDLECKLLKSLKITSEPIWVANKSDAYGFDILSYRKNKSGCEYKVYIEVKTTTGGLSTQFYCSQKEKKISQKYNNKYFLYRVYDASDEKTIKYKCYKGDITKNRSIVSLSTKSSYIFKVKNNS